MAQRKDSSAVDNKCVSPVYWTATVRTDENVKNTNGLTNEIKTTKYTIFTWLPKSIWEQFRRIANLYFLLISVLMLIGTYAPYIFVSPLEPFSTILALIFVLMVTSLKEGMEDYQRSRSDQFENLSIATIIEFGKDGSPVEKRIERRHIKAGDVVKLDGHCVVPVDMILILTSLHSDGNQCYVETASIDGETSLKLRQAPAPLQEIIRGDDTPRIDLFKGSIEFEPPNKIINEFVGTYHLDAMSNEPIPLDKKNILLRSSVFSNTDWGYGIAVYCGQETKIQMCNRHAPFKMSKLESYVNKAIVLIFAAQMALVAVSIACMYGLGFDNESEFPYIFTDGSGSTSVLPLWLELWFVFFLLYNNFIPISLYVTIELVNLGQSYFVAMDGDLYHEPLNMPCSVRSSNLVQELGVVNAVFSDKTGTLTKNEMVFVQFYVGERGYVIGKESSLLLAEINAQENREGSPLYCFLQCIATCHTVVREKNGTYRAESPDELALIEGVDCYECGLLERGTTDMICNILGERQTFRILAVNAFNSKRKRMSVLLEDRTTGLFLLMCKGADNLVLPLCELEYERRAEVDKALLDYSCLGLRTLCIARRVLDPGLAEAWLKKYKQASSSLENREKNLEEAAAEIEVHMELLGITAVEDKLQDEVPEVIADLTKAGIVVWMLTGDKEETAINIGHSCNLLTSETKSFFLTRIGNVSDFEHRLNIVAAEVARSVQEKFQAIDRGEVGQDIALVLDGDSFKFFCEENPSQRSKLLQIGKDCRSVIACRLTPDQKKQLVSLVKIDTVPRATTLSIGDGANDVSMIMEADVGVGIFGKEGRQAANNADFAIGQFKFLRKLLLVHGRWNYCRQSKVFLYSMHKNMVLTLTLFWFSFFAALSGTSMYESWVYNIYNFALGLPIIFFGIFDQDLSQQFALRYPQVYSTGMTNTHLSINTVIMWIVNAAVYAVIFCLLWFNAVYPTFQSYSLYEMGTTIYIALVFSMHLKVAFMHHLWNQLHFWSMFISVGGLFLFLYLLNSTEDDNYNIYFVVNKIYSLDLFWFFGVFSVPLFCVLFDVIGYSVYFIFEPTKEMLFREAEQEDARTTAEHSYRKNLQDSVSSSRENGSQLKTSCVVSPSASENRLDSSGTATFQMTSIYQQGTSEFSSSVP